MLDTFIPKKFFYFLDLIRFNKPIGFMLLMWPCWFGLAYSGKSFYNLIYLYFLFFLGSFLMRSAGCIVNDLIDIKIDRKITRTYSRPLASKKINILNALIFLCVLLILSFVILIQFSVLTIIIGLFSIPIIVLYPLMKRITYWPQLVLGIVFSWGVLITSFELYREITLDYFLLYLACIFWTLSYDTIYAYQDRNDDISNNVKSTAVLLGEKGKLFVRFSYFCMLSLISYLSWKSSENLASLGVIIVILIGINIIINKWQPHSAQSSNYYFRQNNLLGGVIFLYLLFF
jgi:4-hydroxybenzoate polyprenyltransferase